MKKTLFICEGNVGRSQMAEGFYNHFAKGNFATSAGVNDYGQKYNFKPREDIIQVMKEKGIDISEQKIKQVTEEMLQGIEMIVVLCNPDIIPEFLIASGINIVFKNVDDPYESTIEGVRQIRDEIEQIVLDLLSEQN